MSINIVLLQAHMYTYLHMVCTEANILIKRSMYTLEGNIGYQVKLSLTILQPVLIKKRFPNFDIDTILILRVFL